MSQIRGPFILPRTSPAICGWPGPIMLPPGAVWVFPPGNSLVTCGPNTILQYYHPLMRTWVPSPQAPERIQGHWPGRIGAPNPSPGIVQWVSSDGANYRLYNIYGAVAGVSIPSPGGGGGGGINGIGPVETGTSIVFDPAPLPQQTAQGYVIIGGSLPTPNIVRPGRNFQTPPIVCCDPPPDGGVQATFGANLDANGGVVSLSRTDGGAGYTQVPKFYCIPQPLYYQGGPRWPGDTPPGISPLPPWPASGLIDQSLALPGTSPANIDNVNGLLLEPPTLINSGELTGLVLTYGGGNYSSAPAITFVTSTLNPGGTATAVLATSVGSNNYDLSFVQAMVN